MVNEIKWKGIEYLLKPLRRTSDSLLILYRGQDCNKPLLPKIARDHKCATNNIEPIMISEFKRLAALFIKNNETDWELLALAQHFGMSTRLLDWTTNPLVALWFACQNVNDKNDTYLYVFFAHETLLLSHETEDPLKIKNICVIKPMLNSSRLYTQSGYFTAHPYIETNKSWKPLDELPTRKQAVHRFTIPGVEKLKILEKLNILGINNMSLFPDLDGICRHLNQTHCGYR